MSPLFEISGSNLYLQLAVTIISISVHLFNTRNTNRKESVIQIITIYVIGLSGWFGIMSGLFSINWGILWPLVLIIIGLGMIFGRSNKK